MDAGGRAKQEQLPRGLGEGKSKQDKLSYLIPLILAFSLREKGLSLTLNKYNNCNYLGFS
jgi:hypothetical protein